MSAITHKPVRNFWRANRAIEKRKYTGDEVRSFNAHGWFCHYCGATSHLTADHVTAKVAGGGDGHDNIVPACRTCNCSKGAKSYDEFIDFISAEKAAFHMFLECGGEL